MHVSILRTLSGNRVSQHRASYQCVNEWQSWLIVFNERWTLVVNRLMRERHGLLVPRLQWRQTVAFSQPKRLHRPLRHVSSRQSPAGHDWASDAGSHRQRPGHRDTERQTQVERQHKEKMEIQMTKTETNTHGYMDQIRGKTRNRDECIECKENEINCNKTMNQREETETQRNLNQRNWSKNRKTNWNEATKAD